MKKLISKSCALLGFTSCVLMLVTFIIMVLPSGVILMTSKKPEILVKTLDVRLPDTDVVYEKPKVGTSWEYEWWCRFKEPMSEHSMKRIESKCGTEGLG